MDCEQHFPHDGDDSLLGFFPACDEPVIESANIVVVSNRDQSGHVEGMAQISIADFADPPGFVDAAAGFIGSGVESGMGDPLFALHVVG